MTNQNLRTVQIKEISRARVSDQNNVGEMQALLQIAGVMGYQAFLLNYKLFWNCFIVWKLGFDWHTTSKSSCNLKSFIGLELKHDLESECKHHEFRVSIHGFL